MNCEICGKEILSKRYEKIVEGVKMILCEKCASHGESHFQPIASSNLAKPVKLKPIVKPKPLAAINKEYLELEVVQDYYKKVKSAREKAGLTQEDFAKMLKEKLSVIQKIETGKIIPDINLAKRMEHLLKIKLLAPVKKEQVYKAAAEKPVLTLGDLAKIKYKSEEKKEL
ncbi:TIGR00270 family protein [Candidatus Bathyarchaeota archaeon]|nr:TIGR00270 family protein [Candidatus Bathyarchaeota archaeon]